MATFKLPEIEANPDGWGPLSIPPQFQDVPFMPFAKNERLGRIADFGTPTSHYQRVYQARYRDREQQSAGGAVFNFEKAEEGDAAFELVDSKPVKPPGGGRGRGGGRWGPPGGRGAWGGRGGAPPEEPGAGRGRFVPRGRGAAGRGAPWRQPWRDQSARAAMASSVDIRPEWPVLGDNIPLAALNKLSFAAPAPRELAAAGAPPAYDRAADRVTPRAPAALRRASARDRQGSTSDDPLLRRLAGSDPALAAAAFFTDELLAALMTAPRSVYPWDMVVTRRGGQLWFDKRPGSSLDFLTNGETAPDPPVEGAAATPDALNGVASLSAEATGVNAAFREQVLAPPGGGPPPPPLEPGAGAAPAEAGAPPRGAGFRYRAWDLAGLAVAARFRVDARLPAASGDQLIAVHALNEFDPKWSGVDWRSKLDTQRGAVLATELKNNAAKIARWTAAALAGGLDAVKLGYVSRASPKDASRHVLLGTQAVKPRDFAAQMNLDMANAWGVVRALVDLCREKMDADGKYLLVRDPNKPQLRIYQVPAADAALAAGGGGGDDEDDDDEGGEGDEE